jgi:Flp pilus assembly protein TadG
MAFLGRRHAARTRSRQRGQSVVEAAIIAPWVFFLFVGALDFGFYSYAAIATQNAARAAAAYTSSSLSTANDAAGACTLYAIPELKSLPNMSGVTACSSLPVQVTAGCLSCPNGYASIGTSSDGSPAAQVTVRYQTIPLVPIPGLLIQQYTVARTVQMRVRN